MAGAFGEASTGVSFTVYSCRVEWYIFAGEIRALEAVGGKSVLLGTPRSLDGRSGDPGKPG